MTCGGTGRPLTGKLSTARCVVAPCSRSACTCISPMLSDSMRVFGAVADFAVLVFFFAMVVPCGAGMVLVRSVAIRRADACST